MAAEGCSYPELVATTVALRDAFEHAAALLPHGSDFALRAAALADFASGVSRETGYNVGAVVALNATDFNAAEVAFHAGSALRGQTAAPVRIAATQPQRPRSLRWFWRSRREIAPSSPNTLVPSTYEA